MDYQFKEVTNIKTGRKTYFVNNKRVSFGDYCTKSIDCDLNGYRYNTSYITTTEKRIYNVYHYTRGQ